MFSQFEMNKTLKNVGNTKTRPIDKENISIEETKNVVKKSKQVTFSDDVIDKEKTFTPFQYVKKKPNYHNLEKNIYKYLKEQQYTELRNYLSMFSPVELEGFYNSDEFRGIIHCSIIGRSNFDYLSFLVENVPAKSINNILKNDNYSVLKTFLRGQIHMEECGSLTSEKRDFRVKKFRCLFEVDGSVFREFSEDTKNKCFLTSEIKEDIEQADASISNQNLINYK